MNGQFTYCYRNYCYLVSYCVLVKNIAVYIFISTGTLLEIKEHEFSGY